MADVILSLISGSRVLTISYFACLFKIGLQLFNKFAVSPSAARAFAVPVIHCSEAAHFVVAPLADVSVATLVPKISAVIASLAVTPISRISVIGSFVEVNAGAVFLSLIPLADLNVAIFKSVYAEAVGVAVFPFSLVNVTVGIFAKPLSVRYVSLDIGAVVVGVFVRVRAGTGSGGEICGFNTLVIFKKGVHWFAVITEI